MPAVRLIGTGAEEWIVAATVPAATPAGQAVAATVQPSPLEVAQTQLTVPGDENWHVEDIFTDATAPATDMGLVMRINRLTQTLVPSFTAVLITNLSRMFLRRTIGLGSAAQISFQVVPLTTVGGVAITLNFKVLVARYQVA